MSTTFGPTIAVRGEIRAREDLIIHGRIEGPIFLEQAVLVLAESADVAGDVIAEDITVFGRVTGQLVATEIVDIRAGATVEGRVLAARLVLDPDASFRGRVEPQHVQAAISVARFNQKKRDALARP